VISDKHKVRAGILTGAMLIGLGILIFPIGLLGFLSTGLTYIGLVMLLLAISGGLLLYGGYKQFRDARKTQKDEATLKEKLNKKETTDKEDEEIRASVLAEWDIDEETWKAFRQNVIGYRNEDNLYYFIGVMILGTLGLLIFRAANLFIAVAISAILGGIIVFMRRQMALSKLNKDYSPYARKVVIGEGYVIMNGHTFDLYSETRTTTKVQFLPNEQPVILEFTISWITRHGPSYDELRIPVPPEQIDTARKLTEHFKSKT
jgi:hypothetical protein